MKHSEQVAANTAVGLPHVAAVQQRTECQAVTGAPDRPLSDSEARLWFRQPLRAAALVLVAVVVAE